MRTTKRKQNALYGWAPSADSSNTTDNDNGRGSTIKVGEGSVINNGGDMKHGLFPTVGVSVAFLNQITHCCGKEMCFNTIHTTTSRATCKTIIRGSIFSNCSRGITGSNCR